MNPESHNIHNLPERHGNQLALHEQQQALKPYEYRELRDEGEGDDDEIDLRELWQVIQRRKWLILSIALLIFLATLLFTLMQTPIYRASTTLQIKPEDSSRVLEYDIDQARAINDKDFYQTQYELLKSSLLADRVLSDHPEMERVLQGEQLAKPFFAETIDSLKESVTGILPQEDSDTTSEEEEILTSNKGEEPLSQKLLENVTISPVKNSQIVTIHYDDPDPERSAIIANAFAKNYTELNLERRRKAALTSESSINDAIIVTQSELLKLETELNDYAKQQGILSTDDKESIASQNLRSLNKALLEAQKDRVKAESELEQAIQSTSNAEALKNSTLQELKKSLAKLQSEYQAEQRSSRSFQDPMIQNLRRQKAELESQLKGSAASLQSFNNPAIQAMKRQLADLQSKLSGSATGVEATNNPTIQNLRRQVAELQGKLSASNSGVEATNNPTVQAMKRELSQLQGQYQEKSRIFKPDYPEMQQLKQRMDSIRRDIVTESTNIQKDTQTNLRQQIQELNTQIARESSLITRDNQANLRQRIQELNAQITRETSAINRDTQSNLQRKIAELDAQIKVASVDLDRNTRSNLSQRIATLQNEIAQETARVAQTVSADIRAQYQAAKQREDELQAQYDQAQQDYIELRDKSVGFNDLKRRVDTVRANYEGLLKRKEEVAAAADVMSNNILMVDEAVIPFNIFKPKLKLNLALGAVLGLFLGLVLAFLLEFLDDRVKGSDELEKLLGLPTLGIVPRSKNKDNKRLAIMSQSDPRSSFAEAFRSLRTNLMFSTRHGMPKVLSITSAAPSEGKTTTAINLATVASQVGKTVLLVDTDLRNPSIHKRLSLDNSKGLTNYLTGQEHLLEAVTQSCQIPEVYVVTAGPLSPNPVELLSSEQMDHIMALAHDGTFDMVIMDMPPVLGLADALIISSRVDATILSVSMGETKKQALSNAYKRLRQARANLIGVVLVKAKQGSGYGYHYDYNYYNYGQDKKMLDAA